MRLIDETHCRCTERQLVSKLAGFRDRLIEVGLIEGVFEAELKLIQDIAPRVKRDWTAARLRDRPKLVDPVAMIAVGMRDDHARQRSNVGSEELLPKVGATIHEQSLLGTPDQDGGPQASITRLVRIALAPFVPDLRHTG